MRFLSSILQSAFLEGVAIQACRFFCFFFQEAIPAFTLKLVDEIWEILQSHINSCVLFYW